MYTSSHHTNIQPREELSSIFAEDPFLCSTEHPPDAHEVTGNQQNLDTCSEVDRQQTTVDQINSGIPREEQISAAHPLSACNTRPTGDGPSYQDDTPSYSTIDRNPSRPGTDQETSQHSSAENTSVNTQEHASAEQRSSYLASSDVIRTGQTTWTSADFPESSAQPLAAGPVSPAHSSNSKATDCCNGSAFENSPGKEQNITTSTVVHDANIPKNHNSVGAVLSHSSAGDVKVQLKINHVARQHDTLANKRRKDLRAKNSETPVAKEGILGILSRLESVIDAVEKAENQSNKAKSNKKAAEIKATRSDCEAGEASQNPADRLIQNEQEGEAIVDEEQVYYLDKGNTSKTTATGKLARAAAETRRKFSEERSCLVVGTGSDWKVGASGGHWSMEGDATIKMSRIEADCNRLSRTKDDCIEGT
jgi:hypothetical protein